MDPRFMSEALALARAGLGRVWPNPSVGCVVVRDGVVVGRGATQPGGRPHAEVVALADAGEAATGATAFVSLEPCAHYGKTPPCADALVRARIARCVVALEDPDPRVDGKGVAKLRSAGIEVLVGLGAAEAAEMNAGFFLRVRDGRPLVATAKPIDIVPLASGFDARLESDANGVWAEVQGTGVAPVRWWVGGALPLGAHAWRKILCPPGPDGPDPAAVLGQLGAQGITRVLVSAADPFAVAAAAAGLVDRTL